METVAERRVGQRLRLFGFSCVHFGDRRGHDAEAWQECLEDIERTDNAIVFGLGDYLDFTRTTYRLPLKAAFQDDDKSLQQLDEMVMETMVQPFVEGVRRYCPSFHKKCVGFVEGNHYYTMQRFLNGHTTTQVICELLGIRYLGLSAWCRVTFYRSLGKQKLGMGKTLNVVLNHSVSSAGNAPASLAAATRKIAGWRGVDVFLSANDHQLGHDRLTQIGCTTRGKARLVQHQQVVGKVGSFQLGYRPGAVSNDYVEKKFLSPSRIGYLAFDAWIYYRSLRQDERDREGLTETPEMWRFDNFNV